MKITRQSTSTMILKQGALGNKLFGIFFSFIGIFAIFISNQNKIAAILIGLIFVIAGLAVTFLSKSVIISLNKNTNIVDIIFSSLLGKKSQQLSFNQIKEVAIEAYLKGSGSLPRKDTGHNLVFYTVEGDNVLIPMGSNSTGLIVMGHRMLTGSNKKVVEMGSAIAKFTNTPFIYREPPSARELLRQSSLQAKPRK